MNDVTRIPPEDLGKGSAIKVQIVETEIDLYWEFARVMFNRIRENNAAGRPSVFIVPVGPIGQFSRLAHLCNTEGVSCENLVLLHMDEYLDDNDQWIPRDHPLSFRGFVDREFYDLLDPDKQVPPENRVFPDPNDLGAIQRKIDEVGGVDIAFGGIGINGHIAVNEPPEPGEEVDPEEFKNRPTRVLTLTRETRTINSVTAAKGNIDAIPSRAVTIGMREILSARKIHFFCNRIWQTAIVRRLIHGPVTPHVPASFFQEHPDATITMCRYVAELPAEALR
ncbi:MAG: glucosamine-6-phosphate isomerase [Armatimonadota bacterium]